MDDPGPVDLAELEAAVGDPTFVRELISTFLNDAPGLVGSLKLVRARRPRGAAPSRSYPEVEREDVRRDRACGPERRARAQRPDGDARRRGRARHSDREGVRPRRARSELWLGEPDMASRRHTCLSSTTTRSTACCFRVASSEKGIGARPRRMGVRHWRCFMREAFDAVLLDVVMPEIDGFEVLAQMQADGEPRHIPVIMISRSRTSKASSAASSWGPRTTCRSPSTPCSCGRASTAV